MKIPTVLGLSFLTIFVTLAVLLYLYLQQIYQTPSLGAAVEGLQVANITSSSVSILWQTKQIVAGAVSYGQNNVLTHTQSDDRDTTRGSLRLTHFVTINNLSPNTTYDFKPRSNQLFASSKLLHFTTAKISSPSDLSTARLKNTPLLGTVLDNKLQPIKESLVILTVPGASPLATFTTTAGNFLLPMVDLETSALDGSYILRTPITAHLEIISGQRKSEIVLTVPHSETLEPIVLGQNSDLTHEASSSGH